jgi:glycerophosphoryl diester phosphodiesterase
MLSEANDWSMDPFVIEANFFLDTVLLSLAQHISTRSVFLSSFNPDICILLSLKQSRWPILFATDAGNSPSTEPRATNIQEAAIFAKKWSLDGVVMATDPIVFAPVLVGHLKEKGLVCATYGTQNDEVEGITVCILFIKEVVVFGCNADCFACSYRLRLELICLLRIMFV